MEREHALRMCKVIRTAIHFSEDKIRNHDYEPRNEQERQAYEELRKERMEEFRSVRCFLNELQQMAKEGCL